MCRLHHEGCAVCKRGSKVRQDIYEKLGFLTRKTLQNMADQNIQVSTLCGKMKNNVPTSRRGVEKTKYRVAQRVRHLEKIIVRAKPRPRPDLPKELP